MLLEVILLLVTCFLVAKLFLLNRKPPGTPPGTTGLPIIGVLPPKNILFTDFLDGFRQKYGDTFWLKMGAYDNVIICKYEDIISAYNNPALQGRVKTFLSTQLLYKYGEKDVHRQHTHMTEILGLVNAEGERWKNVRRFVIRRLRDGGMGKSSSMESIIMREAEDLVKDFEKYVGKPTEIPWSVNTSILNVVWGIIADQHYDIHDKEIQQLCTYLNDVLAITQDDLFLIDGFPWIFPFLPNFILNYMGKKKFEDKMKEVYKPLHKAVAEHRKTLDVDNPRDLIDSYLIDLKKQENDSPNKTDYSQTFSERELVQTMFDLFLAGSETTSSTVKWHILYMSKYPEIQRKVQEEIDSVVPKDRMISLSDRESLPYLESCIHETLRMKSILPFGLIHVATENTTIGEYLVPKGTHVFVNIISCHRDPKFWKRPNDYYPEHFLNDDGKFNSKKEGFMPFSTGRRVCIGENLAKMDLFLVLGTLLQKFTFSVPEGETISDEEQQDQPFITIPKPFKIIMTKRT